MEAAVPIASKYRKHVGYGFSMGGFGAIKYAPVLHFTHTYAFSPQVSIDPSKVGRFDQRYAKWFEPSLNAGEEAIAWRRGQTYLIYDPAFSVDARHADIIDGRKCCHHVHAHAAGHETVALVRGREKFRLLLLAGELGPEKVAALVGSVPAVL